MITETSTAFGCTASHVLADIVADDLLQLEPGERLWKLYCFVSPEGKATGLRHRIYTKRKQGGRLAMVTFAVHSPAPDRIVRSALARVPDLSAETLEQIIGAIRQQTHASASDYEEIDPSSVPSLDEQFERLRQDDA